MAHSNSTTNYALPQFIATDKPAWLTDVNQGFEAIDLQMKANANAAAAAAGDAAAALSAANDAMDEANLAEHFKAGDTFYIGGYFPCSSSSNGKTITGSIPLPKEAPNLDVSIATASLQWVVGDGHYYTDGSISSVSLIGGGHVLGFTISVPNSIGSYVACAARITNLTVNFSAHTP